MPPTLPPDPLRQLAVLLESQAALLRVLAAEHEAPPPPPAITSGISIAEAARRVGVSRAILARAVARREIPAAQLGPRTYRVTLEGIQQWLSKRRLK